MNKQLKYVRANDGPFMNKQLKYVRVNDGLMMDLS